MEKEKKEFVYHYCFRGVKDGIETYNNGFIDLPCKPATASESQELREYLLKNLNLDPVTHSLISLTLIN